MQIAATPTLHISGGRLILDMRGNECGIPASSASPRMSMPNDAYYPNGQRPLTGYECALQPGRPGEASRIPLLRSPPAVGSDRVRVLAGYELDESRVGGNVGLGAAARASTAWAWATAARLASTAVPARAMAARRDGRPGRTGPRRPGSTRRRRTGRTSSARLRPGGSHTGRSRPAAPRATAAPPDGRKPGTGLAGRGRLAGPADPGFAGQLLQVVQHCL